MGGMEIRRYGSSGKDPVVLFRSMDTCPNIVFRGFLMVYCNRGALNAVYSVKVEWLKFEDFFNSTK